MEAKRPPKADEATPSIIKKDVEDFSGHCVLIRSVWVFSMRIFRDSDEAERSVMETTAPSIFEGLAQVLKEYHIIAACRITDPAKDGKYENFTVETFVNSFKSDPATFKQLDELRQRMKKLRDKIETARNKLAAHADREAIRAGKPLGEASFEEWEDFWSALKVFVRILNEKMTGKRFDIDAGGASGDAGSLLKALRQSQHFKTLLEGDDQAVADACRKLEE